MTRGDKGKTALIKWEKGTDAVTKKGPLKWHDKKDQFSAVTKGGQLNEFTKRTN